MTTTEDIVREMKERWSKASETIEGDFISPGYTAHEEIAKFIESELLTVLNEQKETTRKEYDGIFKWLLGENGEFPNLAEKPHYSFRSQLRKRLEALQVSSLR